MWFLIFGILGIAVTGLLLLLVLFEPGLSYRVTSSDDALDSEPFLCQLGALADAQVRRDSTATVFSNGKDFYAAQLDAIRNAKRSINLEAYILRKDATGRSFIGALTERARAGVKVNVIVDAIGSFTTWDKTFADLRAAGGTVCWYQPIRWYTFKRFNNRTHRELLIVDGTVGFIGGAGIADEWATGVGGELPWRDTVARIEGDLVNGLQSTFAENWVEANDEILTGETYFPGCPQSVTDDGRQQPGELTGLVVISAPSAGRSTRARVLFQLLLASAQKTILINSPYFLPDGSVRREMIKAAARGVKVRVIAPGDHADHLMTRRASRRRYGELLRGGVEIYEYVPAMIHAKVLTVDGIWAVIGSTNFDNRSFGINDEVNLAARGGGLVQRLQQDFDADLKQSRQITLEEWERRPWTERIIELSGVILERHQ